jgi:hypothetical protein
LVDDAKAAVDKIHNDTSVDQGTTLESLKDIIEHTRDLVSALKSTMVKPEWASDDDNE